MGDVRFKKNSAGFREVANVMALPMCGASAARIASAAGPGHASDVRPGKTRAHARAYTTTAAARMKETGGSGPLKRAVSAGRI